MRDAVRLAVGTLTVLPFPAPTTVDRRVAAGAMTLAPAVGAALAVPLVAVVAAVTTALSPLAVAVVVVGLLAVLTRGIHLDGLADTADGLGSARSPAEALAVMRRGDVGPFGVVSLVLALLLQVAALAELVASGTAALGLALALVVSRLVLPLACFQAVPAARADGLGATVAGSLGPRHALAAAALGGVLLVLSGLVLGAGWLPEGTLLVSATVAPLGLLPAGLLLWHCVRRLGGVTGDVLGALVETAFTATLVLLTLVW